MIGKHWQFREITLRDFRCFHERQTVPLEPLTLLVGENSTGKTSFLAAVRAVWDTARTSHWIGGPDFRQVPYDLGAFPEIVYSRGGRANGADSFSLGFKELDPCDRLLDFEVTFESHNAAPAPTTKAWRHGAVSVEHRRAKDEKPRYVFESPDGSFKVDSSFADLLHQAAMGDDLKSLSAYLQPSAERQGYMPSSRDLAEFSFLLREFSYFPTQRPPFASAPIHPPPRRTYDPTKLDSDPWGADVPSRLASLQFQDKSGWTALKGKLDAFGRESGLFDDFSVKQLTKGEGGPFQLQVRKFGKGGRKGPKRNLMDVGFGVSQVLPTLAALFRADGPSMFLLQQPELHLHPSAQAALGSLFCEAASSGRQLIIETHSDYILDRIRLDVRDRRTKLKPEDVAILYFERGDRDVRIHPIRFDEDGNVRDTPPSYRRFFVDEVNRSIDY